MKQKISLIFIILAMSFTVLTVFAYPASMGQSQSNNNQAFSADKTTKEHTSVQKHILPTYNGSMVYLAGVYSESGQQKPCFWAAHNRIVLPIPEGCLGNANSITTHNGTVYTTGSYCNKYNECTNCYWENTKRIDLPAKTQVNKIYFFNGQKYMTGSYYDDVSTLWLPCYWKGNARIDLPVPTGYTGGVSSLYIKGRKVYTCGYYASDCYGSDYPCYWEGTARFDLPIPKGNWGHANSIYVKDEIVYTAGGYFDYPAGYTPRASCYWKGTTRIDLSTDDGEASKIFFYMNKLYILGTKDYRWPLTSTEGWYWKDGTRISLPLPPWQSNEGNSECFTSGMYFYHGKIYTSGCGCFYGEALGTSIYTLACYWEDSTRTDLAGYGSANAICVDKPIKNICPIQHAVPSTPPSTTISPVTSVNTPTPTPVPTQTTDGVIVYTVGDYLNTSTGWLYPCYWKGVNRTDLPLDNYIWGSAKSINIYQGKVYSAGSYYDSNGINCPCYWEDTTRVDLPTENEGQASDIFVDDGKVYIAGSSNGKPGYWVGTTWVNLPLVESDYDNGAQNIFVDKGTVYITDLLPYYWKNDVRVTLPVPEGYKGEISAIYIYQGVVYAAGSYSNNDGVSRNICYWKGSTRIDLPVAIAASNGIRITSICVYGGNVYTAGKGPVGACYWVGTTRVDLPLPHPGNSWVKDIQVYNGKVYTAGFYEDADGGFPCYWVDTTRIDLPCQGEASGLFVENGS